MPDKPETLSARLPIRLSQVRDFATEVEAFGKAAGLSHSRINTVNLTLDELIANVVMYGFEDVANPEIVADLKVGDNKLVLTLEDNGKPFDPTQDVEPDITSSLMDRPIGGLGRYFVMQLASRLSYEFVDGRNRLTVEYDLDADGR